MSLKAFHIVFIGASVLLCAGFAVWEFMMYRSGSGMVYLFGGMLSLVASVYLVGYGVRFLRKLKHVRFI